MDIARLLPNRPLNLQPAQAKAAPVEDEKPSIAQSVVVALSLHRTQVESPKDEDPQGILQALRRAELETSENRKSMARAELERLKERIAHLKMMLAFMGPSAAKGLAAQIKALASQMGNLASILKEGGGGGAQAQGASGVTSAMAGVTQAVKGVLDRQVSADASQLAASAEGAGTEAAQAAASVASAAGAAASASQAAKTADAKTAGDGDTNASAPEEGADAAIDALEEAAAELTSALQDASKPAGSDNAAQRREDAKLLREALESLKQLIALYKASRQRQTGGDGSHPDIDDAVKSLQGVENAIGSLGGASTSVGGLLGF